MANSTSLVFLSAVRIGFGAFGGALRNLSATDLGVAAAGAALLRAGLEAWGWGAGPHALCPMPFCHSPVAKRQLWSLGVKKPETA